MHVLVVYCHNLQCFFLEKKPEKGPKTRCGMMDDKVAQGKLQIWGMEKATGHAERPKRTENYLLLY